MFDPNFSYELIVPRDKSKRTIINSYAGYWKPASKVNPVSFFIDFMSARLGTFRARDAGRFSSRDRSIKEWEIEEVIYKQSYTPFINKNVKANVARLCRVSLMSAFGKEYEDKEQILRVSNIYDING